jgi:hypothetical protein
VHGAADPRNPSGPVTQTISIMPATGRTPGPATEAIRLDGMVSYTRPTSSLQTAAAAQMPVYSSRRAAREAEQQAAVHQQATVQQQRPGAQGALAGSLLSPSTWKQTFDALKKLR